MRKTLQKTYHISPLRLAFFISPGLFFVLLFGVLGAIAQNTGLVAAAALVTLIYSPFLILALRIRLILSAEGVDLHQFGCRMATSWENIEQLDTTKLKEGFILKSPLDSAAAKRLAGVADVRIMSNGASMAAYQGGRPDLVLEKRFIPIEAFGYWIRKGDLEKSVRQFAPELLIAAPHQAPAAKVPMGNIIAAIVTIIGAMLLGLLMASHAFPPPVEEFVARVMSSLNALACLAIALVGFASSYRFAKSHRWGWAATAFLSAVMTSLIAIVVISGN